MDINVAAKQSNYISKTVQAVTKIMSGYYDLLGLQDSNVDQGFVEGDKDYGLKDDSAPDTKDGSFAGENDHLNLDIFTAGLKIAIYPIIAKIEENNFEIRKAMQKMIRA